MGSGSLSANTEGSSNIALGNLAGSLTTKSGNIEIGNIGTAADENTIRIGTTDTHKTTFIAGIFGTTQASGMAVQVGADGKLGVTSSSRRFKTQIEEMGKTSDVLVELQPVCFRYKKELDPNGVPQFGLVAEEVEKVDPDLIIRDQKGNPFTVRYEAVNAMLLNEFIKEHRKVDEQATTVAAQEKALAGQKTTIEELQKQVQSISAQLEKIESLVLKANSQGSGK